VTALLVAATGGHLAELHDLVPRLDVPDRCWATFDMPQSRSLLAGEDVVFVPPAESRELWSALQDCRAARRLIRQRRFEHVVSTGSSIAVAFFVPATAARIPCHYIESATRTAGPSLTGRLVAHLPRTELYTQHRSWATGSWRYGGSIYDPFVARPRAVTRPVRRVVVTLGLQPKYGFPRLLRRLKAILPDGAEVLWQLGDTRIDPMPAGARREVPPAELRAAMREADVVIAHAGVGATLDALRAGHRPLCVPRRRSAGEQVDDHQLELATELDRRGLVFARDADAITPEDLDLAARWCVEPEVPPPFRLVTRP
jgi:UDP-N-acetylglucosamine--N-acetylmuramyl-(pentapeptide) pyrophosphoryl-undecaprenol N-acetylglucosamine transferase